MGTTEQTTTPKQKRVSAYTVNAKGVFVLDGGGSHNEKAKAAMDAVEKAEKLLAEAGCKIAFTCKFGSIMVDVEKPADAPAAEQE